MTTTTNAKTWRDVLADEKQKPYFQNAMHHVNAARAAGKTVYPAQADIFNAFKYTPFDKVRVVILGQDPYHGPRQAHGLCFSVMPPEPPPPSLKNIFKELQDDCAIAPPPHGCLIKWAEQGVLLLNTTLTVERGHAHSHAKIGWSEFTDAVIRVLDAEKENLVFLLWGAHAQSKASMINPLKHTILRAPHPSPLSAHRGFLGCNHFSKTNERLKKCGLTEIDWNLNT